MKKSLVALATMTVAGITAAQSSVTMFGVVDASVSGYTNTTKTALGTSIKTSKTVLTNSAYNASRWGLRGTEDLGGGLAASFWLESQLLNDDGNAGAGAGSSQLFNRRSTISLSGALGEVRLGRDYVPSFWNDTVFDPFGGVGVGINMIISASGFTSTGATTNGFGANPQSIRSSNSIGYFLPPNLGGFYGQIMYAFNEQTSYDPGSLTPPTAAAIAANPSLANTGNNARAGKYVGGRFGYSNGRLDVAGAYANSTIASNYFLGTTTTLDIWNLGASYDFGVVKLFSEYSNNKLKVDSSNPLLLRPTEVQQHYAFEPGVRIASFSQGRQVGSWLCAQSVQAHGAVRHSGSIEQQEWSRPDRGWPELLPSLDSDRSVDPQ